MRIHTSLTRPVLAIAAGAVALAGLTGCASGAASTPTSSSAAAVAITPRLDGADNFRDIGGIGAGYTTADGKHVRRGVVYRSNALTLKDSDLERLKPLEITEVIDLRTPDEIAQRPDTDIPGATWTNLDVLGGASGSAVAGGTTPSFDTPAAAEQMMTSTYESFITSPSARTAIAGTLTAIAKNDGATVIHCTAGTDRTGWTSAILLDIAGVDRTDIDIDNNFLLTNQYSRASISATLAGVSAQGGESAAAAYAPLLGVEEQYLDAAYDTMTSEYGSLNGYLTKGLGLSSATIEKLKSKLTA